MTRVTRDTV